ncbi:MAG: glycosyltransferase family 2 protein [Terriglobia bacterium]
MTKISIVIPTKNAGPEFENTLALLKGQEIDAKTELLIIDSGSVDSTLSLAARYGAKILHADPASFNHGETRNCAIREASGEIIVLTVQDAVAADKQWLHRLTEWFRSDAKVAGTFGKQVPRPDADLLATWEVETHNKIFDKGTRVKSLSTWDDFLRQDFMDRFDLALFDNVSSAIRKSVWQQIPFKPTEFAEDMEWALEVMRAGYRIVHEPKAAVVHSHNRPAIYRWKRHFVTTKRVMQVLEAAAEDYSRYTDETLFNDLLAFAIQVEELIHRAQDSSQRRTVEVQSPRYGDLGPFDPRSAKDGAGGVALLKKLFSRLTKAPGVVPPGVPVGEDPLRGSFNFTMKELLSRYPSLKPDDLQFLFLNVAARAAGDVLSKYYYWCGKNQRLSETMRILGATLSQGI